MSDTTNPHHFHPLRPWDLLRPSGRCICCFLPKDAHPIRYWAPARPVGDKRPAEISWEALTGEKPAHELHAVTTVATTSMKMSIACAIEEHDRCDGTAFGNAADDAALMASTDVPPCDCICHTIARARERGYAG